MADAKKPHGKRPFDAAEAVRRLRTATAPYPKAALFELAAAGHTSVFEVLAACVISIRTRIDTVCTQAVTLGVRAKALSQLARPRGFRLQLTRRVCLFRGPIYLPT